MVDEWTNKRPAIGSRQKVKRRGFQGKKRMDIVNTSSLRFAPIVSLDAPGKYVMTMVVKGTFRLVPRGPVELSSTQAQATCDQRYEENEACSLRYESDFAPHKPNADLMLIGSCHTPKAQPLRMCEVTYSVGKWSKSLKVHGDRNWTTEHGLIPKITEASTFVEMPLRYERSFGGPGNRFNPLGKGSVKVESPTGVEVFPLPNIEDAKQPITTFLDRPSPAGFGPIDQSWQQRSSKIGTYDDKWRKERWPCLPKNFDMTFYNAAPPDSQLPGYLQGDEQLEFRNLHPVHVVYPSQLPGLRVRCFVNEHPREPTQECLFREVPLNLDTLFVDMERENVYLLWRGRTPIQSDDYAEVQHVFIHTEPLKQPPATLEECRLIFLRELETGGVAAAASVPIPNVDECIAKVEQCVAAMVASSYSAEVINRQMDPRFGGEFPLDLASKSLDEQGESLDVFAAGALASADSIASEKEQQARAEQTALGIDVESQRAAAQKASLTQQLLLLGEIGVDQDLKQLDLELKQTSIDLYRLGIDLGTSTNAVASLSNGLSGFGLDAIIPGMALAEETRLSRETVAAKVQHGDSFDGVLLRGIDLSALDLKNADFRGAIIIDCSLEGADLSGADLSASVLTNANLRGANLAETVCSDADMSKSDLSSANLTGAILTNACLENVIATNARLNQVSAQGARFVGADLTGASLQQAVLTECDLSKCTLTNASFRQSIMLRCTLTGALGNRVDFVAADLTEARAAGGCELPEANFQQAQGKEANWSGANLSGADLSFVNMPGAFFIGARLENANLSAAGLRQARFTKAKLCGARLVETDLYQAAFDGADLSQADLSHSNAFEANFFDTVRENTVLLGTNLKQTLLTTS
jgi:uncharacterized protein YjbI with pentapeptide repeats